MTFLKPELASSITAPLPTPKTHFQFFWYVCTINIILNTILNSSRGYPITSRQNWNVYGKNINTKAGLKKQE